MAYPKIPQMIKNCLGVLVLLSAVGCGRYIPPVSPTILTPTPVQEVNALPLPEDPQRISITWVAPDKDMRGKLLSEMDGYSVQALFITADGTQELTDKTSEDTFEEIVFIPDTYLSTLKAKQEEAEERGDIVRRVKVSKEQRTFSYTEPQKTEGTVLYRILAVNSEGGKGPNDIVIQVTTGPDGNRAVALLTQAIEIQ